MSSVLKEHLEKMSDAELRELLESDLRGGGDLGGETILAAVDELRRRGAIEDGEPLPSTDEMWTEFRERYLPEAERRRRRRPHGGAVLRAACAALAAIAVTAVVSVSASAAGYDIWGAVATWTSERFTFTRVTEAPTVPPAETPEEGAEYSDLAEALDAYGIEERLVPTWLPSGYDLTGVEVTSWAEEQTTFYAEYIDREYLPLEITVVRHQSADPDYAVHKKDSSDVRVYTRGGVDHYIMGGFGRRSVTWLDGCFECTIRGELTDAELERMIDSIYEPEA